GMCLLDTTDGALMMTLYTSSARDRDPLATIYYSIILTGITVMVAICIGTIQLLSLVANVAEPEGPFWDGLERLGAVGGVLAYKPWRRWVTKGWDEVEVVDEGDRKEVCLEKGEGGGGGKEFEGALPLGKEEGCREAEREGRVVQVDLLGNERDDMAPGEVPVKNTTFASSEGVEQTQRGPVVSPEGMQGSQNPAAPGTDAKNDDIGSKIPSTLSPRPIRCLPEIPQPLAASLVGPFSRMPELGEEIEQAPPLIPTGEELTTPSHEVASVEVGTDVVSG
ncbi:hypothetical protein V493_08266, partial [Pseudogymnoascus sp. VKM F-4281 (FW-2241)]